MPLLYFNFRINHNCGKVASDFETEWFLMYLRQEKGRNIGVDCPYEQRKNEKGEDMVKRMEGPKNKDEVVFKVEVTEADKAILRPQPTPGDPKPNRRFPVHTIKGISMLVLDNANPLKTKKTLQYTEREVKLIGIDGKQRRRLQVFDELKERPWPFDLLLKVFGCFGDISDSDEYRFHFEFRHTDSAAFALRIMSMEKFQMDVRYQSSPIGPSEFTPENSNTRDNEKRVLREVSQLMEEWQREKLKAGDSNKVNEFLGKIQTGKSAQCQGTPNDDGDWTKSRSKHFPPMLDMNSAKNSESQMPALPRSAVKVTDMQTGKSAQYQGIPSKKNDDGNDCGWGQFRSKHFPPMLDTNSTKNSESQMPALPRSAVASFEKLTLSKKVAQNNMDYSSYLDIAVEATRGAGHRIKTAMQNGKAQSKTSKETHHAAENLLIAKIKAKYPGHRFVAKGNYPGPGKLMLTNEPTWVIDPLDGTKNFLHSIPMSAISAGFFINSGPVLGIIFNPMTDQLYTAVKGQGAFLNGNRIKAYAQTAIEKSYGSMGSGNPGHDALRLGNAASPKGNIQGTRVLGSAGLSVAAAAAGRAEAFYDLESELGWRLSSF